MTTKPENGRCPRGVANTTRIDQHEHDIERHERILERVMNRLPVWAVLVIAGLSGVCGSLLVLALQHGTAKALAG